MTIETTHWMMNHFEPDAIEQASIKFTFEIMKTATVVVFAIAILGVIS